MDKKLLQEIPKNIFHFINRLNKDEIYLYDPSISGVTENGKLLSLGYSCYALKIYFMTGEWEKLETSKKQDWINFINSFQVNESNFPKNSFIDPSFLEAYSKLPIKQELKFLAKSFLNSTKIKNFDNKSTQLRKSINAETKQAISSLYQIGNKTSSQVFLDYKTSNELEDYLKNLDWSKPWTSGAQFSSICVYNEIQNLNFSGVLKTFTKKIANSETGSYYTSTPDSSREVINGAMKVISGLDWINEEIHFPKKLIDYCLKNVPIMEGCDIVDFVYVLYMCSKQTDFKKKEINEVLKNLLDDLLHLYNYNDNAFSYYKGKSQTHYYGVDITYGLNTADIHGSTLCLWALIMILENLELSDPNLSTIKP